MTKEELLELGKSMRDGQRARASHGCGEGRSMLVSRNGAKIHGWCFRCNEGLHANMLLSLRDNLSRITEARALSMAAEAEYEGSVEFPVPLLEFRDWPQAARVWFLKAGLTDTTSKNIGAGWHEDMQRVVMPLFDRHSIVRSWTARAVDGRRPKYLTGCLPEGFVAELGIPNECGPVVVEDWLSANKIAMAGVHVICLLGTYPKAATLSALLEYPEVTVWLDNDTGPGYLRNYGQELAAQLARSLRRYGTKVYNVVSNVDPKFLWREAIRAHIAAARTP